MRNLRDSILFAVVGAGVLYIFLSFCPPTRGADFGAFPASFTAFPPKPSATINCPCPDGGTCVCGKDGCLCGPTCKCPDCPGKSDPLQLAANRKTGRWVALANGDFEWKVGGVSEGIWSASTRQFRYHGQTKTQYVASVTDVVSFAPVNAVLGPPPMGPMMFQGDCPGGVCRPR